jgi:hypothetical protein
MGKNYAALRNFRAGNDGKLAHKVSVGQAVEAKPSDAGIQITAWDGKQLGDVRKIFVERSIEAGNLWYSRKCFAKTVDKGDFARQLIEIERLHSPKFSNYVCRDKLIVNQMRTSFDDAMSDRADHGFADALTQIGEEGLNAVMERLRGNGVLVKFRRIFTRGRQ